MPTDDELKAVGKVLAKTLREKASRQSVDSPLVGIIATQNALVGNGQLVEAIQMMLPHVCPTPDAFATMFPNSGKVQAYLQGLD